MKPFLNIAFSCLEPNVQRIPHKTALLFTDGEQESTYTFLQVQEAVFSIASQLETLCLPKGESVFLRLSHSPVFCFAFLAVMAKGWVAVPCSPLLTFFEAQSLQKDCLAQCVLLDSSLQEEWKNVSHSLCLEPFPLPIQTTEVSRTSHYASTSPEDPAYMVYTSGTTSQPKGVLHAHRSFLGREPMLDGWHQINEKDVLLHAGHLNWTYTMGVAIFDCWKQGATSILYNGPKNPSIWSTLVQKHQATLFAAVPSVYRQMIQYSKGLQEKCRSLRYGLTAGESLQPSLLQSWRSLTGKELYEALGMSECSTYLSNSPSFPIREGSSGKIQTHRKISLLPLESNSVIPCLPQEKGVLAIHSSEKGLMLGYWQQTVSKREEWFLTGDTGYVDEEGYFWFEGRQDGLMNSFGYRVSPLEVEASLQRLPSLLEVAVAEIQLSEGKSIVVAFLVFDKDVVLPAPESLQKEMSAYLAYYKMPREWVFLDELPKTKTGKIQRSRLEKIFHEKKRKALQEEKCPKY